MKISVESGRVTDEGMVYVPKKVYESMGLKPGSEVDFIAVPTGGIKIDPRALVILRNIRSAKKKPSAKLIEKVVGDIRKMQAAKVRK